MLLITALAILCGVVFYIFTECVDFNQDLNDEKPR